MPETLRDRLLQVVPVEVHDLGPGRREVAHELFLRVVGGIDLGQRPQLRVAAEHKIGGRGGPLGLARSAIAAFVDLVGRCGRPPS